MKDQVKTYPELKERISRGEKVTMSGKLMSHAKLSEIPLHEIKIFLAQGYFESETKTDLTVKPAIEGEFIGKDDNPNDSYKGRQQSDALEKLAWAQQAAMGQMNSSQAAAQQQAAVNALGGLGQVGLGSALFWRGF